ncbi:MAG: [NiFe]-hydrogenase assembly chaperone HybE [Methylobacter sp.]
MAWQDSEHIRRTLEATFIDIMQTRMRDVPVLNPALSVQALGFSRYQQDWLGVLITPWFMNLLLLPEPDSAWQTQQPGSKFSQPFPYGLFEFTVAQEAQLGIYAQCSLFSPMFEFVDQISAVAAAQSALHGLLTSPAPRVVSRRDLLRGNLGKGNP